MRLRLLAPFESNISVVPFSNESATPFLDPYLQIAGVDYGSIDSSTLITVSNLRSETGVLILRADAFEWTASFLISLPLTMYNAHGAYWSSEGFVWAFAISAAIPAAAYSLYSSSPPHVFVLHLAAAAFMTVSGEKAYHSIRAGQRLYEQAASLPEMDVTLAVLVVCVDIAAAIFAFVVAKFSVRAPCTWSMAASAASLALLFAVGAGWYVGPILLHFGGLLLLASRRSCR